jgi:hypothetical protein
MTEARPLTLCGLVTIGRSRACVERAERALLASRTSHFAAKRQYGGSAERGLDVTGPAIGHSTAPLHSLPGFCQFASARRRLAVLACLGGPAGHDFLPSD